METIIIGLGPHCYSLSVSAWTFLYPASSQGSQSTHSQRAAHLATIPQMTENLLQRSNGTNGQNSNPFFHLFNFSNDTMQFLRPLIVWRKLFSPWSFFWRISSRVSAMLSLRCLQWLVSSSKACGPVMLDMRLISFIKDSACPSWSKSCSHKSYKQKIKLVIY